MIRDCGDMAAPLPALDVDDAGVSPTTEGRILVAAWDDAWPAQLAAMAPGDRLRLGLWTVTRPLDDGYLVDVADVRCAEVSQRGRAGAARVAAWMQSVARRMG